jgi:hypothetical protein
MSYLEQLNSFDNLNDFFVYLKGHFKDRPPLTGAEAYGMPVSKVGELGLSNGEFANACRLNGYTTYKPRGQGLVLIYPSDMLDKFELVWNQTKKEWQVIANPDVIASLKGEECDVTPETAQLWFDGFQRKL